jgi:hypothetical protein
MRRVALLVVGWVLSACASGRADPSLDADAKLFRASADKACIYVVPSSRTHAVTVTVDGRKVGTLTLEHYLRLDVAPGHHVLDATRAIPVPTFFRAGRDGVAVDSEAGQCYFFRVAWTESDEAWREFRVHVEGISEDEGRRAVNVRWLTTLTK